MDDGRIVRVEWAVLEATRPRAAGSNARLGPHGATVRVPLARLTTNDGSQGFGFCRASGEEATRLLGTPLAVLWSPASGVAEPWLAWDYPVWDLMARRAGKPVYALAAAANGLPAPTVSFTVPTYDTSLYFDDLDLTDDRAAADRLAAEAREGYDRGHRAFKIKVGRGGRWMEREAGTRRDIAIVRAVRDAVGRGLPLMIDANNGYTLNLAKHVLTETAAVGVFWLEEPFHEDAELDADLRAWIEREQLQTLIADGEGDASPRLMEWVQAGYVQVIQYDIIDPGFTRWLTLGKTFDRWGVRSAPHSYGTLWGNYATPHLMAAVRGCLYAEWDAATAPALDASGYRMREGRVQVPDRPGFGLALDEALFRRAVAETGYTMGA